jgi:hypothetical protein
MSEQPAKLGRPLKFQSAKEIDEASEKYFAQCIEEEKPFTITGLCIALGTFRNVLMDYQDGKYDAVDADYSNAIKRAKLKCEQYAESQVFTGRNPAGAIFVLKNYGWTDKTDVNHSGQVEIKRVVSDL